MKNRKKLQRWLPDKINLDVIEQHKNEVERILENHWDKHITGEEAEELILIEFHIVAKANNIFLRIIDGKLQFHIMETLLENKALNNRSFSIKKLFSAKYLANEIFDKAIKMLKT